MTIASIDGAVAGTSVPAQRQHPPDAPMPPAFPTAKPVSGPRLTGVDAARGVALLGMMAVHALMDADAPAGRRGPSPCRPAGRRPSSPCSPASGSPS